MTATLEQIQSDLLQLLNLVQQGIEMVIMSQGRALAKISAVPQSAPPPNRQPWLAQLSELRAQLSVGKTGSTVDRFLYEDRGH